MRCFSVQIKAQSLPVTALNLT